MADIFQELEINSTVYDVGVKGTSKVAGLDTRLTGIDGNISANAGAISDLQEQVDVLQSIGRFLSLWNGAVGLMTNEPATETLEYQTGDYFIVGTLPDEGEPFYKPSGATYTQGVRSWEVDDENDVEISDMYIYNGSAWGYLANHARQIAIDTELDTESVNPVENRVITEEVNTIKETLKDKQDKLSERNAGQGISITPLPYKNLFNINDEYVVPEHMVFDPFDTGLNPDDYADENYTASGFIEIDPNKDYTLSFLSHYDNEDGESIWPALYGFDENKGDIGIYIEWELSTGQLDDYVEYTFNVVDNFSGSDQEADAKRVKYIRFDLATASEYIQVEQSNGRSDYEPYKDPTVLISNTQTSAEWGKITGNIKDQKDLQRALEEAGGGGGAQEGVITWLDTRNINNSGTPANDHWRESSWKGQYADILFKISGSKSYLIDNMNDINICVNRFSRAKHDNNAPRNQRKYRILNDHLMETTLFLYCWRVGDDENDTNNSYFYTTENYNDDVDWMMQEDPQVLMYRGSQSFWSEPYNTSTWATTLNHLAYNGYVASNFDAGRYISRYEKYDVNCVYMNYDLHNGNAFQRMRVREYEINGQVYYLGSTDWRVLSDPDTTGEVWVMADSETDEPIPRCICRVKDIFNNNLKMYPKSLGQFGYLDENSDYPIYKRTDFKRRKDLEFYIPNPETNIWDIMDMITYNPFNPTNPSWNDGMEIWNTPSGYAGDYPIGPVRLSDCSFYNDKIRLIHHEDEGWDEWIAEPGQYLNFYEVVRNHPEWLDDVDELIFKLPYSTYDLLMRIHGYQKRLADTLDFKNNLPMLCCGDYGRHPKWGGNKGMMRFPGHGRLTEKIQFYTNTSEKIFRGERPSVTPISKTLAVVTQGDSPGGSCKQTLY